MKMNKFLSAMMAVTMIATSFVTANAETKITLVDDGVKVVGDMPTGAEIAQRTPTLTYENVEVLADYDAVKAAAGTSYAKKTKQNGNYDVYKLTMKISNVGELVNGWDESWDYVSFLGVNAISFQLGLAENDFIGYVKNTAQLADGTFKYAYDGTSHNFIYSASENGNPYPSYVSADEGDASYVADQPIELEVFFAFPAGTAATLDADDYYYLSLDYQYNSKGDIGLAPCAISVPESFTFGAVEPDEPETPDEPEVPVEEIVVAAPKALKSGIAWDVTINGYDSAKTYVATFTAGTETKVNDLTIEAQTGATINFAALLKTTKTGVELKISKN